MNAMTSSERLLELASRESNGLEVSMWWDRAEDAVTVSVWDLRSGEVVVIDAPSDRALDVFNHPFAYAAPPDDVSEEHLLAA